MIFKKHIIIMLTFSFLVSNLGLAINVHYCGNKIVSVALDKALGFREAEKNCCGIIEKKSKCCNDKIIKVEVKSDQIPTRSVIFYTEFISVYNDWKPLVFNFNLNFKQSYYTTYFCDTNKKPLYLLYSQYTFYS